MEVEGPSRLPFAGGARELIRDLRSGVRAEIAASRSGERLPVEGGREVARRGATVWWSFDGPLDPAAAPPPETPARMLLADGTEVTATVVAVGDDSLTLAVDDGTDGVADAAELVVDPSFILGRLLERLDDLELRGDEPAILDELLDAGLAEESGGGMSLEADLVSADEEQDRAARLAVEPGFRITWGPPGTGKTRVLARAVATAVERGDSVLVVAHANAAVDVAAARIAAELAEHPALSDGRVLRVGTPVHPSEELAAVSPSAAADRQDPAAAAEREQLRSRRAELSDLLRSAADTDRDALAAELDTAVRQLRRLERAHRDLTKSLEDDAQVVITTLSRAVLSEGLWSRDWDVVLVDEASMVPLPMALALALRNPTTFSILGDPRQLPPVHRSDDPAARHWFARDLFEQAGFAEPGHDPFRDPRVTTLRMQFRMGESICDVLNATAYDGLLRTHRLARNRGIRLAESAPCPAAELVVVDTSGLGGRCWDDPEPGSWSRWSPTSGLLAATLGARLVATGCESVALVSPYRAQVRWLAALAGAVPGMSASTIHRMQGGEADAVVLDIVDASPRSGPSVLTGGDPELAERLLTVAVSRARGKLVVLIDRQFLHECVPLGSPVRTLIEAMVDLGADEVDAGKLLADTVGPGPVAWFDNWDDALGALSAEGRSAGPGSVQPSVVADTGVAVGAAELDSNGGPVAVAAGARIAGQFRRLVGTTGAG
jgi:hypothetical protein